MAVDPGAAGHAIPQCRPLHSGYAIRKRLTGRAQTAAPLPHAPAPRACSRSSEPAGRPARSRVVPSAAARPPPVRCERNMPASSIPQTWYACLSTLPHLGITGSRYYTWVDQHNTLGLGNDVPISTGNENDALLALVDGKWVVLRVPYPLSFYAKGLDGRIDDPSGGWKGRGLWTTSGDRTPWLKEGGKGTTPLALHIQLRPNPLAD